MLGLGAFRTGVAPGGALAGPWVRNPLWRNARAVPSLDLQFADNKSLVDGVTSQNLVTFTRASNGTYVGSDGLIKSATTNEPRFDHNPTTGESLGLLVEEARTNLLLWSEDFGNVIWLYTAASVSTNTSVAPDGTTTADTINAGGTAVASQSITKTASAITYTASVFVKGTVTGLSFTVDDGATVNRGRCVFNLSTGTLSSATNDGTFTNTSGTITTYPNGWYRITCTTTTNSTTIIARHRFFWSGSGTSIDVWGAQLEAGAFATSYIPTTTATVTRAADVASITGSNFSSWYNQTEGTVFGSASVSVAAAYSGYVAEIGSFNDGFLMFRQSDSQPVQRVRVGGADQYINGFGAIWTTTGVFRNVMAYKADDFAGSINGGALGIDASGTLPVVSSLQVGRTGSTAYLNGHIRRITFWPTRLSNTTLQQITQP
jgi:hypothetical protein